MLLATLTDLQNNLKALIGQFFPVIIGVLVSLVAIWGIFLGVKYWQAGTQDKHREAKEYVKNFIIGIILIFVIIAVATTLVGVLGEWVKDNGYM